MIGFVVSEIQTAKVRGGGMFIQAGAFIQRNTVCINDLPQVVNNSCVAIHDTILYCSGSCVEEVRAKFQEDLKCVRN